MTCMSLTNHTVGPCPDEAVTFYLLLVMMVERFPP